MTANGCDKNDLSWGDGQVDYDKLRETISEAVSGYAHLYAYGIAKTSFLTELLAQPVRNLEDFVLSPMASRRNSVAVCLATRTIYTTVAQHETRIHYSNGSRIN